MNKNQHPSWFLSVKHSVLRKALQKPEDFAKAVSYAEQQHLISQDSYGLINSVIQIANMSVRDVMTPRNKVISINLDTPINQVLEIISNSAHSRFPVFSHDEFIGVLLAKDVLIHFIQNPKTKINIRKYIRPPVVVPTSKSLELLLKEFQINKNHMFLVVDEYKNITGLLTIEDVLEQIVGEIEDEHDFEEDNIIDHSDGRYLVRANTPLDEFNAFFNTQFSNTNANTIAGIVLSGFEHMPKQLEKIELSGVGFKVLKSDHRRLQLLEVNLISSDKPNSSPSSHK